MNINVPNTICMLQVYLCKHSIVGISFHPSATAHIQMANLCQTLVGFSIGLVLLPGLVMSRTYLEVSSDEYSDESHECYLSKEPPSSTAIGCAILCEALACLMSQTTADGCVICNNCTMGREAMTPETSLPLNMFTTGKI